MTAEQLNTQQPLYPKSLVDVRLKDAEELREIAAQFDALGKKSNGDFLREVAGRHAR